MDFQLERRGEQNSVRIRLWPGESVTAESNAMYRTSENVELTVARPPRKELGFLEEVKRLFTGGDILLTTFRVDDDQPGEIGLAPALGKVAEIRIKSSWICRLRNFLAAPIPLVLEFDEIPSPGNAFPSEELLRVKGQGELLVTAETTILPITVRDQVTVDAEHLVAWEESLTVTADPGGRAHLLHFSGIGQLLMRSANSAT